MTMVLVLANSVEKLQHRGLIGTDTNTRFLFIHIKIMILENIFRYTMSASFDVINVKYFSKARKAMKVMLPIDTPQKLLESMEK